MIINCGECAVRGAMCARCTVTFVTEAPGEPPVIELDDAELRALAALADAGMIPPLRYTPPRRARLAGPAEPMAKAS
jgi:hypothetical protein